MISQQNESPLGTPDHVHVQVHEKGLPSEALAVLAMQLQFAGIARDQKVLVHEPVHVFLCADAHAIFVFFLPA